MDEFLGYDDILMSSIKVLAEKENNKGKPKGAFVVHFASDPPRIRRLTPPQRWSIKGSFNLPPTPEPMSLRDKMSPICLGRPTYQPIKLSATDYLAKFTRVRSRTRIVGSASLFDFG